MIEEEDARCSRACGPTPVRDYVKSHRGSIERVYHPDGFTWTEHAFFDDRQDAVKFVEWGDAMGLFHLSIQVRPILQRAEYTERIGERYSVFFHERTY